MVTNNSNGKMSVALDSLIYVLVLIFPLDYSTY